MDDKIPIIEVTEKNFESMLPAIKKSISESFFIALDCELSGLGNRSKLNCGQVDIRYKNVVEIAQEYSIVSLGLSCFICQSLSTVNLEKDGKSEPVKSQNYVVQTFNILTLCSNPYIVEGASMKFLASHGFDFNKQYTQGLPYTKASKETVKKHCDKAALKDVFSALLKYEKPLIFHNGFVDLMFLYDSFYTQLPKKSEVFAADLSDMFPNGIFDTKYISEFHQSFPATFLEYIFRKLQMENETRSTNGDWAVRLKYPPYPSTLLGLNWHPCQPIHSQSNTKEFPMLCESYKFHGWCSKGNSCSKSHDINRIVRELNVVRQQKRRRTAGAAEVSVAHCIHMKKQKRLQIPDQENDLPRQRIRIRKRSALNNSSIVGNNSCSESDENSDSSIIESNLQTEPLLKNSFPNLNVETESLGRNSMSSSGTSTATRSLCSGHRAGFDAFMTGYIFACILSTETDLFESESFDSRYMECPELLIRQPYANRIYLSGKEFPFLISKSAYASQSKNHRDIFEAIKS